MATYTFRLAANLRAYAIHEIQTDTREEALARITAIVAGLNNQEEWACNLPIDFEPEFAQMEDYEFEQI